VEISVSLAILHSTNAPMPKRPSSTLQVCHPLAPPAQRSLSLSLHAAVQLHLAQAPLLLKEAMASQVLRRHLLASRSLRPSTANSRSRPAQRPHLALPLLKQLMANSRSRPAQRRLHLALLSLKQLTVNFRSHLAQRQRQRQRRAQLVLPLPKQLMANSRSHPAQRQPQLALPSPKQLMVNFRSLRARRPTPPSHLPAAPSSPSTLATALLSVVRPPLSFWQFSLSHSCKIERFNIVGGGGFPISSKFSFIWKEKRFFRLCCIRMALGADGFVDLVMLG